MAHTLVPGIAERFRQRIQDRVVVEDRGHTTPCWVRKKGLTTGGYGQVYVEGTQHYLHRVAYVAWIGAIPEGLEIDHLCRVRACCNPDHLEAVTPEENKRRGRGNQYRHRTACSRGHEYVKGSWFRAGEGKRVCMVCRRERKAARR